MRSRRTAAAEGWCLAGLALLAAVRVASLAVGFPFFNNIDEHRHVDTVVKYARGYLPGPEEVPLERDVAEMIVFWGSPEYRAGPDRFARGAIPRPPVSRRLGPAEQSRRYEMVRRYRTMLNLQAHAPPAYYLLGGSALRLAWTLGLDGPRALYVVRMLNGLIAAALVGGAGLLLRSAEDPLLRLGVPVLLAAWPNDIWYSVANDALLPLFGGIAFLLLVRLVDDPRPSWFVAAGLCIALALLTKVTAIGLLGVAIVAAAYRKLAPGLPPLTPALWSRWLALLAAAAIPVGSWAVRNRLVVGSFGGASYKGDRMGVEMRPPSEWLEHALISEPSTWPGFLSQVAQAFWRGEFWWYGAPHTTEWLDGFYAISAALLLALATVGWIRRRRLGSRWRLEGFAILAVAVAISTLVGISILLAQTGDWGVPWSESGLCVVARYVSWALVPVTVLYVGAAQLLFAPFPRPLRQLGAWGLVVGFAAVAIGSELAISGTVFESPYNWYHLGTARSTYP
ncbi:MAG: hypothetical protein QNK04_24785 [Myxococcota bacterium]|nr:hypothetical protein [Myxococcota bacterium]